ncbi:MFS transporter [Atopobiaceae bacterium 24-176]
MKLFSYHTQQERDWIMYDVGNSALVLLSTTVVPIYFNALAAETTDAAGLVAQWGMAQTVASLIVALLMPILGSLADYSGNKIKFFTGFFATGLVACLCQALPVSAAVFLGIYVVATVGLNSSMTFYDAMLVDVTDNERMDDISSAGFAWGYIGSTVPFLVCIALIFGGPSLLGLDTMFCTQMSFIITGVWWLCFTVPLLRSYRQVHFKDSEAPRAEIRDTFRGLARTMRDIFQDKHLFMFLVAFFFYIDGVHTVIAMATSYGSALGIDSTQLILALLVTQFVAFPSAIAYGKLADRFGTLNMIVVAVVAYCAIVGFAAFFLKSAAEFWVLAVLVGLFQGGIQALSRSYFGKIIPKDRSNEYFGFYDIFGRYASVMGTFLVSVVTALTGYAELGVLSIAALLVVGLVMLVVMPKERQEAVEA